MTQGESRSIMLRERSHPQKVTYILHDSIYDILGKTKQWGQGTYSLFTGITGVKGAA